MEFHLLLAGREPDFPAGDPLSPWAVSSLREGLDDSEVFRSEPEPETVPGGKSPELSFWEPNPFHFL